MKLIKLNMSDLTKIVNESIKNILKETNDNNLFNIITLTNKQDIKEIKDELYNLMLLSYEKIGGMVNIHSSNHLAKSTKLVKMIIINDEIIAAACYMSRESSYKMICLGCNQTEIGKQGVQAIIKDDIQNYNLWFWCEVSGAVEHYFKKHNGYPIPSEYAKYILNYDDIIEIDELHYSRKFSDGSDLVKCIYGFKNKELYDKITSDISNYRNFIERVNKLPSDKTVNEFYTKYPPNVYKAIYITDNIYSFYEDGFCEMMPIWVEYLQWAKQTLIDYNEEYSNDYIETINFLLDLDVLNIHTF